MNRGDGNAAGASGAILGLIGFNLMFSAQRIAQRVRAVIRGDGKEDRDEDEDSDEQRMRYEAVCFAVDSLWLLVSGFAVSKAVNDVRRDWKFAKQRRGQRELLRNDSVDQVSRRGHLCGLLGGMIMFAVCKMME